MRWFRGLKDAPVTAALIGVNVLVFLLMAALSGRVASFDGDTLIAAGALVMKPGVVGSPWRWLTAAFIHGGLLHIGMNVWVLGQIGALSEKALGRGLFAATYVVTGVVGNVLSVVLAHGPGEQLLVGASGAVMGLIGMAAMFAWRTGQRAAARSLAFNILFVLAVGLSLSASGLQLIGNAAHVGGLVAGGLVGLGRVSVRRPMPAAAERALVGGAFAVTAVAFAMVLLAGR